MPFTTNLVVKQIAGEEWEVVEDLTYQRTPESPITVVAPAETDFASVPVLFRWLVPKSGVHSKAAVLHDHLWRARPPGYGYAEADRIFRDALHELGVPLLRRWIMWAAVRWVSIVAYRDGVGQLPLVLLVTVFPGLFVIAGGLLVLPLLGIFWLLELLAGLAIGGLRTMGMHEMVKPYRPPAVIAHAKIAVEPGADDDDQARASGAR